MKLDTKHFGTIEIDEKGIIEFSEGLPGFDNLKRYILLGPEDETSPFKWLQSTDDCDVAFTVADPFLIKKDYDIEISDNTVEKLAIENHSDVLVLSIVVIPEDISKTSMNLMAPIIINKRKKLGAQVVLDTGMYNVRHYIAEELRKQEVAENAGADKKKRAVNCNR